MAVQDKHVTLSKGLVDCGCSGANIVINESIVEQVCEQLQISPIPLSRPKTIRGYDGKIAKKPIIYFILPNIIVNGHWESSSPVLIANTGDNDIILGKPWMNRHGVLLDMMRDEILFVPGRCSHDGSRASSSSKLAFARSPGTAPPPPASLKPLTPLAVATASPEPLKKKEDRHQSLDIVEVSAAAFYIEARTKDVKLFSLTMNDIHSVSEKPTNDEFQNCSVQIPNDATPSRQGNEYIRGCESQLPRDNAIHLSGAEILSLDDTKSQLPREYHDFLDVFDRSRADELPPHRAYDHKVELVDGANDSNLPKSRIYPISGHKLEQVKKYLDENLKKGFITPSKAPFASPILFAEKPNGGLRFCVDYRKLNHITKRNRYPIPLIDEVLARV